MAGVQSYPAMVTGFPADIARTRSIEMLEELLKSTDVFSSTDLDDIRFAVATLRSDADHAEDEAEQPNTPLWWGRLLTQPLPFSVPTWQPCSCFKISAASVAAVSWNNDDDGERSSGGGESLEHPIIICPHLLRLHTKPAAPFLPRALPGPEPSDHPFGVPKNAAEDAIRQSKMEVSSLLAAPLPTRVAVTVSELDAVGSWQFDVFQLTSATRGWPLAHLGYSLFEWYGLTDRLKLPRAKLVQFLLHVEYGCNYNGNPYHCSVHTADMLQACHVLVQELRLATRLSDFDLLAIFLAAIIHNYRHPGLTNTYLMASQDALSLLYNDVRSVENFACSAAFRLLAEPELDMLCTFDPLTRQKVRQQVIALVFATNLTDHFFFLETVKNQLISPPPPPPAPANSSPAAATPVPAAAPAAPPAISVDVTARKALMNLDQEPSAIVAGIDFVSKADPRADLILKLVVKSADVSPAARQWGSYSRWAKLQMEEFYRQGDLERAEGLTLTRFMDRFRPQEARCHHTFVHSIVSPIFSALEKLVPASSETAKQWRENVDGALEHWSELELIEEQTGVAEDS